MKLNGIQTLPIGFPHVAQVAKLPFHHRDPFDRLLIVQSKIEKMPLVSKDRAFALYDVTRLW
ncbi:MAG: type II toxin-antitoxin system VapC family toxin [Chloroflexi bacterium]|nr:type II toxin-antitoxin system VapC family toxin [Chloroflexota bacterium]